MTGIAFSRGVAVMVDHLTYLPNGVEIFLPHSKTD